MTKIFFLEPTDRERLWLRRYRSVANGATPCEKAGSCCNAMFQLGEGDIRYTADGYIDASNRQQPPNTDPRWPSRCDACGCRKGAVIAWLGTRTAGGAPAG